MNKENQSKECECDGYKKPKRKMCDSCLFTN